MRHGERIVDAFKENRIEQILLIDDGYDPPSLDGDVPGELTDFLESADGLAACGAAGISTSDVETAKDATQVNDIESEDLLRVNSKLYKKFITTRDQRFDPGGRFEDRKGTILDVLAPLDELLKKCVNDNGIQYAGLEDGADVYKRQKPQIVFLDYHLGPNQQATGGNPDENVTARAESIELLNQLLKDGDGKEEIPAIVLMSSAKVGKDVERFRQEVKVRRSNPLALRFRFLQKDWVSKDAQEIKITYDAVDALLDTAQGFIFGQELQRALGEWRKGAESAMDAFLQEISGLEPKDFAYLFRFRLDSEGVSMGDYLKWMFGESLRALIDEHVSWDRENFPLNSELSEDIEGAFDGPTTRIARIFHRIKIDEQRLEKSHHYALGDIYVSDKRKIRAVITPDCDLVTGEKRKPKVSNVLTMGGELQTFDQDSTSADQFVICDEKPYSLKWNPKDLETFPIKGQGSLCAHPEYKFFGTLRPLYAQHMQRQSLTDLSRVGLAVAPAIGIDAKVTTWLRVKSGKGSDFKKIDINESAVATLIVERGDAESGYKILLRRKYLFLLLDRLNKIEQNELLDDDKLTLSEFLKKSNEDQIIHKFLTEGLYTKAEKKSGPRFAISKKPDKKNNSPWLQFLLEIPEEAMEELCTIDPTLRNAEDPETESDE